MRYASIHFMFTVILTGLAVDARAERVVYSALPHVRHWVNNASETVYYHCWFVNRGNSPQTLTVQVTTGTSPNPNAISNNNTTTTVVNSVVVPAGATYEYDHPPIPTSAAPRMVKLVTARVDEVSGEMQGSCAFRHRASQNLGTNAAFGHESMVSFPFNGGRTF